MHPNKNIVWHDITKIKWCWQKVDSFSKLQNDRLWYTSNHFLTKIHKRSSYVSQNAHSGQLEKWCKIFEAQVSAWVTRNYLDCTHQQAIFGHHMRWVQRPMLTLSRIQWDYCTQGICPIFLRWQCLHSRLWVEEAEMREHLTGLASFWTEDALGHHPPPCILHHDWRMRVKGSLDTWSGVVTLWWWKTMMKNDEETTKRRTKSTKSVIVIGNWDWNAEDLQIWVNLWYDTDDDVPDEVSGKLTQSESQGATKQEKQEDVWWETGQFPKIVSSWSLLNCIRSQDRIKCIKVVEKKKMLRRWGFLKDVSRMTMLGEMLLQTSTKNKNPWRRSRQYSWCVVVGEDVRIGVLNNNSSVKPQVDRMWIQWRRKKDTNQ